VIGYARSAAKRAVLTVMDRLDKRDVRSWSQPPGAWGMTAASGRLEWDGVDLHALAERHGTPLHVINRGRLEATYRRFRDAFASRYPRVDIGYSYKTNPLPAALRVLHEAGATAEVISHYELWLALRLGVPGARIVFNGPGKTPESLALALEAGVKLINIDGATELATLERLAAARQRPQRVGVRVVTSVGWSGQFGMPLADGTAYQAFQRLAQSEHLHPCAIHVHLGSGLRDTGIYLRAAEETLAFMRRLRDELGIVIDHLDLGGGFGVETVRSYSNLDHQLLINGFRLRPPRPGDAPGPEDYAAGIVPIVERHLGSDTGKWPELILEPGRAVTSSAQCLLVSVLALKRGDRHGPYAILDGGRNLMIPTGYEYHEVLPVTKAAAADRSPWTLFGPLCHPGDLLFKRRDMPAMEVGDVVAVMDAGAYFIPNQMTFSNPRPAVAMIERGEARVVRVRETFEDLVALDEHALPVGERPRSAPRVVVSR
jgi:diaminopimelate decarboxylase